MPSFLHLPAVSVTLLRLACLCLMCQLPHHLHRAPLIYPAPPAALALLVSPALLVARALLGVLGPLASPAPLGVRALLVLVRVLALTVPAQVMVPAWVSAQGLVQGLLATFFSLSCPSQ
jgi:hypothetical protein